MTLTSIRTGPEAGAETPTAVCAGGVLPPLAGAAPPPTNTETLPPIEGEALPSIEGEALPPLEDEALPSTNTETLPPLEGEALPPLEGEAPPPTNTETLPPFDGEALRSFEGDAVPSINSETLPPLEGEAPPSTNTETLPPLEGETLPSTNTETLPPLEGEAPPPTNTETLPSFEDEALPPLEGEALPPLEGETLPPLEGEAPPPTNTETLSPTNTETLSAFDGEALSPINGEALRSVDGDGLRSFVGEAVPSFDEVLAGLAGARRLVAVASRLPLAGADGEVLARVIAAGGRLSSAVEALLLAATAAMEAGRAGSGRAVLRDEVRMSARSAARKAAVGEQVSRMPNVARGLARGVLTVEHAEVLADTARRSSCEVVDSAPDLLETAAKASPEVLRREARVFLARLDRASANSELGRQRRARSAALFLDDETGMGVLNARFDPVGFALVRQAVENYNDALWRRDGGRDGTPGAVRDNRQRLADSVFEMLTDRDALAIGRPAAAESSESAHSGPPTETAPIRIGIEATPGVSADDGPLCETAPIRIEAASGATADGGPLCETAPIRIGIEAASGATADDGPLCETAPIRIEAASGASADGGPLCETAPIGTKASPGATADGGPLCETAPIGTKAASGSSGSAPLELPTAPALEEPGACVDGAASSGGAGRSVGQWTPSQAPNQLVIVADIGVIDGTAPDGRCEMLGAGPVPASILDNLSPDTRITAALFAGPGRPLWLGRDRRHATAAQQLVIAIRDRGCVLCHKPMHRCQYHHIDEWHADNGTTDPDNLAALCNDCHNSLHKSGQRLCREPATGHWTTRPRSGGPSAQTSAGHPAKRTGSKHPSSRTGTGSPGTGRGPP